jgi:hypothetical protein
MIEFETNIDTVAIQLDFDNHEKQRDMLDNLWQFIIDKRLGRLDSGRDNHFKKFREYQILYGGSKIATIHTGYTSKKNSKALYYIHIRFAGLKSFNENADDASYHVLMEICAYLNTEKVLFRFVELDIALDIFCEFENIVAGCIRPARNVRYNPLGYRQYFNGVPTMYIEELEDAGRRKNAYMRSYLYDKRAKEGLHFDVTRWELKLQNRYFLSNGFNMYSIEKALGKYEIAYFNEALDPSTVAQYDNFKELSQAYSYRRISPDIEVIEEFIDTIQNVTFEYH